MDLASYNFSNYCHREAFAVESKIVYFGSEDKNATFVLEEEEECEQLKVVGEDLGFYLTRFYRTASCVLKNEIYAFRTNNCKEVHRYSLKSRTWSLFYHK